MKEEITVLTTQRKRQRNTGNQSRIEKWGKKKSKTRRGKRAKHALKHFTIFYQNIRGITSKVDSLTETVDDTNRAILCRVETHMLKEEITIPEYERVFREDGRNKIGGIMISIKDSIKKSV